MEGMVGWYTGRLVLWLLLEDVIPPGLFSSIAL